MKQMHLLCAAKVNLSLDVTGRRPDGYHTLDSIFQTISVYDKVSVSVEEGDGIFLTCNLPYIPCDERNLAYRAANAMLVRAGMHRLVRIRLQKRIPSGAGMGGGSADAAGVLFALNRLLGCGFSGEQLRETGLTLGADVPFLLMGGTALARGVGEELTPLRPLPELPMVIVKGRQSISTPKAYAAIDALESPRHPDTASMLRAVETQDIALLCRSCGNLFEDVADCRDVELARAALLREGARCAVMTGSGSAVFGIFDSHEAARESCTRLRESFPFAYYCKSVRDSFIVLRKKAAL